MSERKANSIKIERGRRVNFPRKRQKRVRIANMFLDQDRPIKRGNILGDFEWRRTHEAPLSSKEIVPLIKGYLQSRDIDPEEVTAQYDKYTGCSMCPCSPGFKVFVPIPEEGSGAYRTDDIWLTLEE